VGKVVRLRKDAPATWQEAAKQFLLLKQAQGLAPRTLEDYRRHLERFFAKHPECWPKDVKAAALDYMAEQVAPAYFNLKLKHLKAFFAWCHREGILPSNPLESLRYRRAEGRVVQLDAKTLSDLLSLPDKDTFSGLRDFALLCLTMDTGIRPSEALSLLPSDVNLRSMEVHVRAEQAKTRIPRTLPISPTTAEAIAKLLGARHPSWGEKVPVFCTQDGAPMSIHGWRYRLQVYSRKLGVKVRPYDLRHAFALHYLRNGGNALALQRTLGHRDLTMTKRYVALTQQDLREQHTLASPLQALLPKRNRVRKAGGRK